MIQIQEEIGGYVKLLEEDRQQYKRTEQTLLGREEVSDKNLRELLVEFKQRKERLQTTRKAIASRYDEAVEVRKPPEITLGMSAMYVRSLPVAIDYHLCNE